jgi:hypothetical protein
MTFIVFNFWYFGDVASEVKKFKGVSAMLIQYMLMKAMYVIR